jgi:hypothetical protein
MLEKNSFLSVEDFLKLILLILIYFTNLYLTFYAC